MDALSDFSLTVKKGDLVGLIGPNGAGKTTALNVLSGILSPDEGRVSFQGQNLSPFSVELRARLGISRTFQSIRLFEKMTVLQNVKVGAHARYGSGLLQTLLGGKAFRSSEKQIARVATEVIEKVRLTPLIHREVSSLSYGDRRRVEIARALACQPSLLLLDEPAAGMNGAEKKILAELLVSLNQDQALTLLLIEHHVPMVRDICTQVTVLNKGSTLTCGPTETVLKDPRVIDVYFGRKGSRGM